MKTKCCEPKILKELWNKSTKKAINVDLEKERKSITKKRIYIAKIEPGQFRSSSGTPGKDVSRYDKKFLIDLILPKKFEIYQSVAI